MAAAMETANGPLPWLNVTAKGFKESGRSTTRLRLQAVARWGSTTELRGGEGLAEMAEARLPLRARKEAAKMKNGALGGSGRALRVIKAAWAWLCRAGQDTGDAWPAAGSTWRLCPGNGRPPKIADRPIQTPQWTPDSQF